MKVITPENFEDITLEQFQASLALGDIEGRELDVEKVKIFAGLTEEQINGISETDFKWLVQSIDEALSKPSEFKQRFEMDGVKFGFHPT
jgi:hypothetical protein